MAESLKIEEIGRSRGPQAKCIDVLAAVAHHGPIERNSDQTRRLSKNRAQTTSAHFKRTIQFDFDAFMRPRHLPRVLAPEPVIRPLALPAVLDGLLEDAV